MTSTSDHIFLLNGTFDGITQEQIKQMLEGHGAKVTKNDKNSPPPTHIITANMERDKGKKKQTKAMKDAINENIPVVSESWVQEMNQKGIWIALEKKYFLNGPSEMFASASAPSDSGYQSTHGASRENTPFEWTDTPDFEAKDLAENEEEIQRNKDIRAAAETAAAEKAATEKAAADKAATEKAAADKAATDKAAADKAAADKAAADKVAAEKAAADKAAADKAAADKAAADKAAADKAATEKVAAEKAAADKDDTEQESESPAPLPDLMNYAADHTKAAQEDVKKIEEIEKALKELAESDRETSSKLEEAQKLQLKCFETNIYNDVNHIKAAAARASKDAQDDNGRAAAARNNSIADSLLLAHHKALESIYHYLSIIKNDAKPEEEPKEFVAPTKPRERPVNWDHITIPARYRPEGVEASGKIIARCSYDLIVEEPCLHNGQRVRRTYALLASEFPNEKMKFEAGHGAVLSPTKYHEIDTEKHSVRNYAPAIRNRRAVRGYFILHEEFSDKIELFRLNQTEFTRVYKSDAEGMKQLILKATGMDTMIERKSISLPDSKHILAVKRTFGFIVEE